MSVERVEDQRQVAGGTGHVGEGIVRVLLREGTHVVVPLRDQARLEQLKQILSEEPTDRLVLTPMDVGERRGADALASLVQERFGRLDVVAAALGGWWQGSPLIEVDDDTWDRLLRDVLTSHFMLSRALLPHMLSAKEGTYVLINGFSAEQAYPGAGPVSVAAAGQLMLARNLIAELQGQPVRVFDLVLGPVMSRARTRGRDEWLTADEIGKCVAWLAGGHGNPRGGVYRLPDRPAADALSEA
jgi:NAD(P)-dependent dehydrogenase (short-subunit alcohol dehydrogenase family)